MPSILLTGCPGFILDDLKDRPNFIFRHVDIKNLEAIDKTFRNENPPASRRIARFSSWFVPRPMSKTHRERCQTRKITFDCLHWGKRGEVNVLYRWGQEPTGAKYELGEFL